MNVNKLKYLRNDDVMGGAKCTARTARPRTPLPYTTDFSTTFPGLQCEDEARHEEALFWAGQFCIMIG